MNYRKPAQHAPDPRFGQELLSVSALTELGRLETELSQRPRLVRREGLHSRVQPRVFARIPKVYASRLLVQLSDVCDLLEVVTVASCSFLLSL